MASFTGIIYLTTNLINGKIYIGQSFSTSCYYIGGGSNLKKAIAKYGKCNFKKQILINNVETIDQLNCLEKFYIKLYDSSNETIGYNIREGGENKSFKHTKAAKLKIIERSNQLDNKKRIKEIQKLAAISRVGTHHTTFSKLKMLTTKFGRLKEIEIYDKENNLLYTCNFSTEAEKLTNVKSSGIRNNLSGLSQSAGGFVFRYKNIK